MTVGEALELIDRAVTILVVVCLYAFLVAVLLLKLKK